LPSHRIVRCLARCRSRGCGQKVRRDEHLRPRWAAIPHFPIELQSCRSLELRALRHVALPRSDLIASASRPDRIPTCSGGAGAISSDAVCGQEPICARAGRFAGPQMQRSKIANRSGWNGTADVAHLGAGALTCKSG